jgi:hypothetical protein
VLAPAPAKGGWEGDGALAEVGKDMARPHLQQQLVVLPDPAPQAMRSALRRVGEEGVAVEVLCVCVCV